MYILGLKVDDSVWMKLRRGGGGILLWGGTGLVVTLGFGGCEEAMILLSMRS